ncbi:MAG: response regulator, partial [Planctomycetes bacterium]|nr:response regulator [Planctomycetota bacterium]
MPTASSRPNDLAATVVVVEDDRESADILRLYLEDAGCDVHIARDGAEGLELAHRTSPDLVILDLMMPKMDGWTVCRELRRTSDVPILILSARQEEEDRLTGLGLGADDYVVKPFSPREIV